MSKLEQIAQEKRDAEISEAKGGKVSGSISASTHYLLSGEGGGSKRDKAIELGVPVINEDQLREMLG